MASDAHDDNHGKSPHAWTAVAFTLMGSVVSSIGVVMPNMGVMWLGFGVIALGLVVAYAMSRVAAYREESSADADHGDGTRGAAGGGAASSRHDQQKVKTSA